MKTIGLIGGMSWESTVTYYQILNRTVNKKLGGLHSAQCLLNSVDFYHIEQYASAGEWHKIAAVLSEAAVTLEQAGADFILVCTNTMHKVVPDIEKSIKIPVLHIAEATAMELLKKGIKKVALLGTRFTMTQDFYKNILIQKGIEVLIPSEEDVKLVDAIIFEELCLGQIKEQSKKEYLRIIQYLGNQGAEGVILGCTEIGLLLQQEDTSVPLFDTTVIHAEKAVELALEGQ